MKKNLIIFGMSLLISYAGFAKSATRENVCTFAPDQDTTHPAHHVTAMHHKKNTHTMKTTTKASSSVSASSQTNGTTPGTTVTKHKTQKQTSKSPGSKGKSPKTTTHTSPIKHN